MQLTCTQYNLLQLIQFNSIMAVALTFTYKQSWDYLKWRVQMRIKVCAEILSEHAIKNEPNEQ